MHIVFVGAEPDPGHRTPDELLAGAWPGFGSAARAVQETGMRVTITQASRSGREDEGEREVRGVHCVFIGRRALVNRVKALAPDVVHFEGLVHPMGLRRLSNALRFTPILAQDHGTRAPGPHGLRRLWLRYGLGRAAGVAFTAREQALPFVSAGVFPAHLPVFEVVEVSSSFAPGDRAAARKVTGMDGRPCLFWSGNLESNKDPLTILEAVARAAAEAPDVRLHMCYRRAPLLDRIRERVASDPRLAARVRLMGEVPHALMERHFQSADLFVQASHVESCGAAVIEALACGVLPIVTDIPSFRRITGGGRYGTLIPVGDVRAFALAIRKWSDAGQVASARAAREHFTRELSYAAMGRQLVTAYTTVATRSAP